MNNEKKELSTYIKVQVPYNKIILFAVFTRAHFFVQFSRKEVNYLMDSASLKEIIPNANWKQEANTRIENIRKRDIRIRYES